MKTFPEFCKPVLAIPPQTIAAAGNAESAAIDTKGFTDAYILPMMGAGDSALALTATESATSGGSYAAVKDDAAVAVQTDFLATDDNKVKPGHLRLDRRLEFLKVKLAATGGTSSLAGCLVVLLNADDSRFADVALDFQV